MAKESAKDPVFANVICFMREGWPPKDKGEASNDGSVEDFRKVAVSLSIAHGCLMYGGHTPQPEAPGTATSSLGTHRDAADADVARHCGPLPDQAAQVCYPSLELLEQDFAHLGYQILPLPSPAHIAQGKQARATTKSQVHELPSRVTPNLWVSLAVHCTMARGDTRWPRWVHAVVMKRYATHSIHVCVVPQGGTWRHHIEQLCPRYVDQDVPIGNCPSIYNTRSSGPTC